MKNFLLLEEGPSTNTNFFHSCPKYNVEATTEIYEKQVLNGDSFTLQHIYCLEPMELILDDTFPV